jgi:hypothetical protein
VVLLQLYSNHSSEKEEASQRVTRSRACFFSDYHWTSEGSAPIQDVIQT